MVTKGDTWSLDYSSHNHYRTQYSQRDRALEQRLLAAGRSIALQPGGIPEQVGFNV